MCEVALRCPFVPTSCDSYHLSDAVSAVQGTCRPSHRHNRVAVLQELEELIEGVEADGIDVHAGAEAATEPAAEHGEQQV